MVRIERAGLRLDGRLAVAYLPRLRFLLILRHSAMSRRCELSGVGPQVGHKVSHSNIKTKRRYEPNLVNVTLASDSLKRDFRLRITAAALRSVDHRGGLDAYLLAAGDEQLSTRALKIKREVKKAAQPEAAA